MAAQWYIPDSLIKTLGWWEGSADTIYIRTLRLCSITGIVGP